MLSVECGSGRLIEFMSANGCSVVAIETSPRLAEEVRAHCEEVIIADLDRRSLADEFPGRQFDVIVLGDIIERLGDPARLLDEARALLGPQGVAVLSISNVAQDLRVAALETDVTEIQGLLRAREDALLALIEQRATLEFESRERIGLLDQDLATSIDRQAEIARISDENAERIAELSAEIARMSEENAERIAQLELDVARGLKRQESLAAELTLQQSAAEAAAEAAAESAAEAYRAIEKDYHDLLGDFETHIAKELEELRREGHQVHELTKSIQRSPFWSLKLAVRRLYRFGRD